MTQPISPGLDQAFGQGPLAGLGQRLLHGSQEHDLQPRRQLGDVAGDPVVAADGRLLGQPFDLALLTAARASTWPWPYQDV